MRITKVLIGLATLIPGINAFRAKTTGGTIDARYCYAVWLRHLILARAAGLPSVPRVVAELGPGDSLGIGLCALLTGAEQYIALDHVAFAAPARNLAVLHELVELLRKRTPVPGLDVYPRMKPVLDDYAFPAELLDDGALAAALAPGRVERIAAALRDTGNPRSPVRYVAPWTDENVVADGAVDYVVSQAVLEHVEDPAAVYAAMARWLRPGGFMSHQIDFKSHGMTTAWNGHWVVADWEWALLKGGRPYLLNREPCSAHRRFLAAAGCELVGEQLVRLPSAVDRSRLRERFAHLTDDDLTTAGAFLQAVRAAGDEPEHRG